MIYLKCPKPCGALIPEHHFGEGVLVVCPQCARTVQRVPYSRRGPHGQVYIGTYLRVV